MSSEKIALVTGGAGGIGAAISTTLAEAGYAVGIHYRSDEASANALHARLPGSFLVKADLSTLDGIDAVEAILKEREGIDLLVNNAGMTADGLLLRAKIEDFDQVINTNMRSTWLLTKKVSRMMMRKNRGSIINISSVVGSTGNFGQTIYGMTKAAIDNFTKSAAMELAHYNILVNSIAPGFIETKMTEKLPADAKEKIMEQIPLKRMGRPEDIAKMVRFLALDNEYATGTVFHINGGMYGG